MALPRALTRSLDTVLDKTLVGGYSSIGPAIRRHWWPADPAPDALIGRHVVVTGASRGLGLAVATGLARLGATVHLVGRDLGRVQQAAATIRRDLPDAVLVPEECDLSDLDSVRDYATRTVRDVGEVHALVHNAGVMPDERTESAQGIELALATHVVGPLLLTELLRPALAVSGDGRVVVVSSGGMYSAPLTASWVDDLQYREGQYRGIRAYARTKRLQVVMAEHLARRCDPEGIAVHSMHPGWAATEGITDKLPWFARLTGPILRDAASGADTMVWLAAAAEAGSTSGLFWTDRRPRPTSYLPWAQGDPALGRRAWDVMTALAGVDETPA